MKKQVWRVWITIAMVLSVGLTGCEAISGNQTAPGAAFSAMRVEAANCNYGGEIKAVEAVDAHTVKFTLCSSDVSFPAKLASPVLAVQDRDVLNEYQGDSLALSANVNGTGAFRVKQQGEDEPLQLRVNNTYWGTPPKVTDILVDWYSNPNGLLTDYETTIVDVANSLNSAAEEELKQNPRFTSVSHPPANVVYLGFNNTFKPFDDPVVRKAIANMLTTSTLVQNYFPLGSEVATQLIPSNFTPGYSKLLGWYEERPKDAIDALGDINFDYSQNLILVYERTPETGEMSYQAIAADIQTQLQAYGIQVLLKPMFTADYEQALAQGSAMMFLGSIQAQYVDGAAFYEQPFIRDTKAFGNPYTEIQELFYKVQAEPSERVRQDDFDQLNAKFKDLVPLIPIGHVVSNSYVRSGDSNAVANVFYESYENISNLAHTVQILDANRPVSLWPADESDWNTFRITRLLYDTLVENGFGSNDLVPGLADTWESNSDASEWTFYLRYNIKFTNGADLDANDIVASFAAIWDASSPNHTGRSGEFTVFRQLFGGFIHSK